MKEGTIFGVITSIGQWPLQREGVLMRSVMDDQALTVVATPDGRLRVTIEGDTGDPPISHTTQPITFAGPRKVLLSIKWKDATIEVNANGVALRPCEDDAGVCELVTKPSMFQGPIAFKHPDAQSLCRPWMDWRLRYLAAPRAARGDRILKSDNAQVSELENEVSALRDLVQMTADGRDYMLAKVAASLRQLVFWQLNQSGTALKSSYSPLLLRIAARLDAPLPVYAFPINLPNPPTSVKPALVIPNNVPSLMREYPAQVPMDLQEVMQSTVTEVNSPQNSVQPIRVMTLMNSIGDVANTLGGAHFDEDVEPDILTLQAFTAMERDFLTRILLGVGIIVADIGAHLVKLWRATDAT